jgi:hypothetical protein
LHFVPWSHGAPYSPIAQTALNISSTANLLVGGYSASAGLPSGALLDEFRIYNRALSADEVRRRRWNIELVSSLSKVRISDLDRCPERRSPIR